MTDEQIEEAARQLYEKDRAPFEMPWVVLTHQHKDRYRSMVQEGRS